MNWEELILWFTLMLPLIITPGPANIATASTSASSGFRAAMVFVAGVLLVNAIALTLMGLGMGLLYAKYQSIFGTLETFGALYIVYLGYKIWSSKPSAVNDQTNKTRQLGFKDGFFLQLLNAKLYPVLIMMFSQFIDGDTSTNAEVIEISLLMWVVCLINYILWAWLGTTLKRTQGPRTELIQRYGFGGLLILIGVALLFYQIKPLLFS